MVPSVQAVVVVVVVVRARPVACAVCNDTY